MSFIKGDRIKDAFRPENGEITWLDLEVRVEGVIVVLEDKKATLDGRDNVGGWTS